MRFNICLVALLLFSAANSCPAWLRMPVEDEALVGRSTLIVLGRLKRDSIHLIDHPGAGSHHHTARLKITRMIKGEGTPESIDIIIRYGLLPLATGDQRNPASRFDKPIEMLPAGPVRLFDSGGDRDELDIGDLTQDHLWFLHPGGQRSDREPSPKTLGIEDPEDVARPQLLEYYRCYLAKDPEPLISDQFRKVPAVRARAQRYLAARELRRIAAEPDTVKRAIRTLPYLLTPGDHAGEPSAESVLVSCGNDGAAVLESAFDNWQLRRHRPAILQVWRKTNYQEAIPRIVQSIESGNRWYDAQFQRGNLPKGGFPLDGERSEYYSDIYYGISTLLALKADTAAPVVRQTHELWKKIDFRSNAQIVEECESFFKRVAASQPAR